MRYNLKTLISIVTIISFLFPAQVMAKITPKPVEKDKKVEVIIIKKGDTLWDLARVLYKDPYMWKKFQELNVISDPNLIYPGEKLVISVEDAKKIKEILEKKVIEVKEEIKEVEAKKKLLEKKIEEPEKVEKKEIVKEVIVKEVPVQDEELLKKIAKLEREINMLKEKDKDKKIAELTDEIACLKDEEKLLQTSIRELKEKLTEEKTTTDKLKKEKQEAEETTHFLLIGIICGWVLYNFAYQSQ